MIQHPGFSFDRELERLRASVLTATAARNAVLILIVGVLNAMSMAHSELSGISNALFAATFLLVALARVGCLIAFKPVTADVEALARLRRRATALSWLVGLVWAAWVYFGQDMPPNGQMVVASLIAGTAFVALGTMAVYPMAYIGFCIPPILALATIPVHDLQGNASYTPILSGSLFVFSLYMLYKHGEVLTEGLRNAVRLRALEDQQHRMFNSEHTALVWISGPGVVRVSRPGLLLLGLHQQPSLDMLRDGFSVALAHGPRLLAKAQARIARDSMFAISARFKRPDGHQIWLDLQVCAADPLMPEQGITISLSDATARRLAEQRNQWLARHDALTGVFNRVTFERRLQMMCKPERSPAANAPFSVLAIDLDGFKQVNDQHGHAVGDEVLKVVAKRMQHAVRDIDMVARVGGDEFLILLEHNAEREHAFQVAQTLIHSISHEISIEGVLIRVGASVGVAQWPTDGASAQQLILHADTTMYAMKHAKRGQAQASLTGLV